MFEYTSPGELKYCLGVQFDRSSDGTLMKLSQQKYARDVLEQFGYLECKPANCPMDPNVKMSLADCPLQVDQVLQKEYRGKVGSLQWLALLTRPDLAYSVSILSLFLHAPGVAFGGSESGSSLLEGDTGAWHYVCLRCGSAFTNYART